MNKLPLAILSATLISLTGCKQTNQVQPKEEPQGFSVKVQQGVPFLAENGKAMRGRMFYGSTGGVKYRVIQPKWTTMKMDFTANDDDLNALMRMSFDATVKNILIKDINLINLSDNSKTTLVTPNVPKTLKRLNVSEKDVKMVIKDGAINITKNDDASKPTPRFFINGVPIKKGANYRIEVDVKYEKRGWFDMVLASKGQIIAVSSEKTFLTQFEQATQAGVNIITIPMPLLWHKKDAENLAKVYDSILQPIIKINPNVRVIPRLGVDAPAWWLDKNPDSEMRNYDGKPTTRMSRGNFTNLQRFAAVSSLKYRQSAGDALKATVELLESKYGKYMMGYHPCGANTGEWFYAQSPGVIPSGYDPSTLLAWRKWLGRKYLTTEALQRAWNKTDVSPETATVPTYDERMVDTGLILDPATRQNVIDFYEFLNDEMADTVIHFGKILKETTNNKKLSLTFYGYGFEFGSGGQSPAATGHFSMRKVLNSPYIDMVSGPISYASRGKGGEKKYMSAVESCTNAGKLWCDEDDNRTYLIWESGSILLVADPGQKTQKDSVDVMRRNLSQQIIRNTPSWWMDLFGAGWYNDPVLWEQITLTKNAECDMIKRPQRYNPPIALVYDEKSMCHIGRPSNFTTGGLMGTSRRLVNSTGIPSGQYLLDDILSGKSSPKLNMFLNVVALDEQQRKQMREVAQRSASIYCWATGYADKTNRKLSVDAIEQATGFKVEKLTDKILPLAYATPEGKKAGLNEKFGYNSTYKADTYFAPIPQKDDVVLAKYSNGKPALVLRKSGKFPQLFSGVTILDDKIIRLMAKECGIHSYTNQPASVYANGAYVSITARTKETHTIDFATDKKIYDALTGKDLGKGPILKFDMDVGEVMFVRIGEQNPKR